MGTTDVCQDRRLSGQTYVNAGSKGVCVVPVLTPRGRDECEVVLEAVLTNEH